MLVIIVVFALLEDNPIQSKIACYIGLRSKFFYRVCWIKGYNVQDELDAILLPIIPKGEEVNNAASILLSSTIDGHFHNAIPESNAKENLWDVSDKHSTFVHELIHSHITLMMSLPSPTS